MVQFVVPAHSMTPENGCCWTAPAPAGVPNGDDVGRCGASPMALTEDGIALPHPHALHNDVRLAGRGRYSHWRDMIYFSTSDGSDPRINGRIYALVPLESAVFAENATAPASPDGPMNVLFIIGCGRSGTTLAADLLRPHPLVRSTAGHPDGEDNEGWMSHGGAAISGGSGDADLDSGKPVMCACLHMIAEDAAPAVKTAMRRYYRDDVLQGRRDMWAVNKNVHICNKLGYVRAIFPEARFVHIIRDPVAVIAGWKKQMARLPHLSLYLPPEDFPCLWMMPAGHHTAPLSALARSGRLYPGSIDCLAEYWRKINLNILRQTSDAPDRVLTMRYEDLCRDPQAMLARIQDFAGLPGPTIIPDWLKIELRPAALEVISQAEIRRVLDLTADARAAFGYDDAAFGYDDAALG